MCLFRDFLLSGNTFEFVKFSGYISDDNSIDVAFVDCEFLKNKSLYNCCTVPRQGLGLNVKFNFSIRKKENLIYVYIDDFINYNEFRRGSGSFCFHMLIKCIIDFASYYQMDNVNIEINGLLSKSDAKDWPDTLDKYFHLANKYSLTPTILNHTTKNICSKVSDFFTSGSIAVDGKLIIKGCLDDVISSYLTIESSLEQRYKQYIKNKKTVTLRPIRHV